MQVQMDITAVFETNIITVFENELDKKILNYLSDQELNQFSLVSKECYKWSKEILKLKREEYNKNKLKEKIKLQAELLTKKNFPNNEFSNIFNKNIQNQLLQLTGLNS